MPGLIERSVRGEERVWLVLIALAQVAVLCTVAVKVTDKLVDFFLKDKLKEGLHRSVEFIAQLIVLVVVVFVAGVILWRPDSLRLVEFDSDENRGTEGGYIVDVVVKRNSRALGTLVFYASIPDPKKSKIKEFGPGRFVMHYPGSGKITKNGGNATLVFKDSGEVAPAIRIGVTSPTQVQIPGMYLRKQLVKKTLEYDRPSSPGVSDIGLE